MKRPHRRSHLVIWLFLFPITALLGVWAWQQRSPDPVSDLPAAIETLSAGEVS